MNLDREHLRRVALQARSIRRNSEAHSFAEQVELWLVLASQLCQQAAERGKFSCRVLKLEKNDYEVPMYASTDMGKNCLRGAARMLWDRFQTMKLNPEIKQTKPGLPRGLDTFSIWVRF